MEGRPGSEEQGQADSPRGPAKDRPARGAGKTPLPPMEVGNPMQMSNAMSRPSEPRPKPEAREAGRRAPGGSSGLGGPAAAAAGTPRGPALREDGARRSPAPRTAAAEAPRTAVLVCHGMGQQVPFETLDLVVQAVAGSLEAEKVNVRLVRSESTAPQSGDAPAASPEGPGEGAPGGKPLPVAEVRWNEDGETREAHFFESYWAPLTEGRIGMRDVLAFLLKAGWQGLVFSVRGSFDRYVFGGPRTFRLKAFQNIWRLLAALLVVVSATALGATFLATAAAHALRVIDVRVPARLVSVLTGELLLYTRLLLLAALPLLLHFFSMRLADALRPDGRTWTAALARFVPVSLAAAAALVLFLFLLLGGAAPPLRLILLAAALMAATAYAGLRFAPPPAAAVGLRVLLGLVLLATAAAGLAVLFSWFHLWNGTRPAGWEAWIASYSLSARGMSRQALLLAHAALGAALFAGLRGFLVQYAGDVAAYVSAHAVSRFQEIRDRIQEAGFQVAAHVYGVMEGGRPMYDRVIVVGHSLGSVVAYDTLNRMINHDLLAGSAEEGAPAGRGRWNVAGRTKLLLTFGSPLDKTAFLFRNQVKDTPVREALAEAWQPLIRGYEFRPERWINIWSPNDIISGPLEFYDLPGDEGAPDAGAAPEAKRVENLEDVDADLPVAAHTQYWRTPLLGEVLARALRGPAARRPGRAETRELAAAGGGA